MSSVSPGGADLVPTTPDWHAWVGFMVTTHFDLVSGPFHSPIFIGLHSVSTSANMYHLHTRAGELPRSASSHFDICICQLSLHGGQKIQARTDFCSSKLVLYVYEEGVDAKKMAEKGEKHTEKRHFLIV